MSNVLRYGMDMLEKKSSQLLSIKEAAEVLPYSVAHLYDLARRNQVPHIKIGGKIRFKREDLAVILDKGLAKAKSSAREGA